MTEPAIDGISFSIPIVLTQRNGLTGHVPHGRRVMTEWEDIAFPAEHFTFPDASAASAALAAIAAAAAERGLQLAVEACKVDGAICALLIGPENVEVRMDPDLTPAFLILSEQHRRTDLIAVRAFSRLIGSPVTYVVSDSLSSPPVTDRPNAIVLHGGNTRPPGTYGAKVLVRRAYGLDLFENGGTYELFSPALGRGRTIDAEGTAVFQVVGNNVYQLLLLYFEKHSENRAAIYSKQLGTLCSDLAERWGMQEEPPPEATEDDLAEYAEECVTALLEDYAGDIERLNDRIKQLESSLTDHINQQRRLQMRYDAMAASPFVSGLRDRLPDDLALMKGMPGVTAVRLVDDGIHLETEDVVLTHGATTRNLGPFVIRLDPSGTVEVWSEAPRHPGGHHHPHIDRKTLTCFGTVSAPLAKHMSDFHYADAARIVLRWLRTYNPVSTLHKLEEWPADAASATHANEDAFTDRTTTSKETAHA
ncbi:MAG: hypothetical protein RLZZ324_1158 [Candidatus Parcubacteria bacterium]|jgi:hypothetical protein